MSQAKRPRDIRVVLANLRQVARHASLWASYAANVRDIGGNREPYRKRQREYDEAAREFYLEALELGATPEQLSRAVNNEDQ